MATVNANEFGAAVRLLPKVAAQAGFRFEGVGLAAFAANQAARQVPLDDTQRSTTESFCQQALARR